MTIWKYSLPSRGERQLLMPAGAQILSVGNQNEGLMLWAAVDDRKPKVSRTFDVRLTGGCYATFANTTFIGTVQFADGHYVAHVFEVLS